MIHSVYGIRGTALHLFQSYLSERKQICKLKNIMSEVANIACGVSQGSNLGPLLFLLYINDLPNRLEETQASMFADDTNLSCQGKKISQSIALLRRAKQFVSQDTLLNMFNALVLPHFTYCSNVWSDGSRVHIEKLHKLHKRAARVITGSNYETRSTVIFEKLGWEKIEIILKKWEHIMTFKALRGETANYLSDLFVASHNDTYQL